MPPRIPARALDGLNLLWHSDLVVSGGGTMNREAAALGVPVYSIFRGRMGAVDSFLESQGLLTLIRTPAEVHTRIRLERREKSLGLEQASPKTLSEVIRHIEAVLESR
ncbi:MAG: DUF354 domain-containing protein [Verrucomicrobia bacterium]|nr:DUF354 domain-containing protein [Verrucomicrobiota bacterium]